MIFFLFGLVSGIVSSILGILTSKTGQKIIFFGIIVLLITDSTGIYTFAEFETLVTSILTSIWNDIMSAIDALIGWIEQYIINWLKDVLGL